MVPLSVPELGGNELAYLTECISSGWVSSVGPFVGRFEHELATTTGTNYAVAVSSGTAALHIALLVAGVQAGDEVAVSDLTFIAPVNAIRYCGAFPVLIDAEPDYMQMDVEWLRRFLEEACEPGADGLRNRATGRRVAAILPVHILGHPCDMDPVLELADRFGLQVVEDATESLGGLYRGRPIGTLGRMACLSFNGNKLITSGGGGAIVTDDAELAARCRYLTTQAKDDPIEHVHGAVGFNYRLTSLQAAVGVAQLERIGEFLRRKRTIADRYGEELAAIPGIGVMREAPWARSAWWLYTIQVDPALYGIDSRTLLHHLESVGIQARPLWQPSHLSPADPSYRQGARPVAEALYRDALSLPSSSGLPADDQSRVIAAIRAACRQ
jgi:perosamine synthetase